MIEDKKEEISPLVKTGRFEHLKRPSSEIKPRINPRVDIEEAKEIPKEQEKFFDSDIRTIVIAVNPDATVVIKSNDLFALMKSFGVTVMLPNFFINLNCKLVFAVFNAK